MPSINDAFPSNYLKAADLKNRQVPVKMDRVEYEMIGQDKKLVLYFVGKEKGMVLNKTNASNIAAMYGDDTDDWRDGDVILFEAMVDFQGKTVPAIRIKVPPRSGKANVQSKAAPAGDPRSDDDMNDTVPF